MEYLIILTLLFVSTFLLQNFFKVRIYKDLKQVGLAVFIYLVVGVCWDTFAIWRGHWIFPDDKILGPKIGLMPIEEYLFILILPYFILTVYQILNKKNSS